MPPRSQAVGLLRTLPSASAWCVRAASSARCSSPIWVWIAQRLRLRAKRLTPGVLLGASFSGYSGGRQRFVVDAGGWEVERVQMPGDGWRDAHDHIASTVLIDLVSLAGITGTMELRGIFSMAVPAEVLAAALAEDSSRRSRPGAVPDYCFTVDGRRMLYDVKRISFCPSRYWPTVAVASSRGGRLSTGHLSFVRSMRQRLPRSTPGQQPGTFGRGPPPQSGHRRQSISSLRSLQFAAWSLAAPLAGGPGRSASSLLRLRRRQPSVSGARSAPVPCLTRGPS
jgi:hypothetical protein